MLVERVDGAAPHERDVAALVHVAAQRLGVPRARRRLGIGAALMTEAERLLIARGCVKLNLQIRSENQAAAGFYARLGYGIDDVISMGRRLIDRD